MNIQVTQLKRHSLPSRARYMFRALSSSVIHRHPLVLEQNALRLTTHQRHSLQQSGRACRLYVANCHIEPGQYGKGDEYYCQLSGACVPVGQGSEFRHLSFAPRSSPDFLGSLN